MLVGFYWTAQQTNVQLIVATSTEQECKYLHMVYVTHTEAPMKEGKQRRVMKMVVIWLTLYGLRGAWQFIITLLCGVEKHGSEVTIFITTVRTSLSDRVYCMLQPFKAKLEAQSNKNSSRDMCMFSWITGY